MINKLENWVFYFFLFAIPISFRHVFNYEPFGFIEWTAKHIYATDVLLCVLFIFWIKRGLDQKRNVRSRAGEVEQKSQRTFYAVLHWLRPSDFVLLAFVAVAAISTKNAIDVGTGWFQWLKLVEGVALYFYIKNYAIKRFGIEHSFMALVLGGLFQAIIAIIQFTTQSGIGLKYLGESVFVPAMTGIAAFYVDGVKVIRAYGTTPHANVLAVYLFIAIAAFYWLMIYKKSRWWWYLFHSITLWAFFLTFSRVILAIWVLNFVIRAILIRWHFRFSKEFWQVSAMRTKVLRIFTVTVMVVAMFTSFYWPHVANRLVISGDDEAVQLRVLYNRESLSITNWFGVGIGNFVPWLMTQDLHVNRELFQPVHNIYLLVYSETGLVGSVLFWMFLIFIWRDYYWRTRFKNLYHISFALVGISILLFGLFDHFLWTIQSGRLIFWMTLALLAEVGNEG